MLYTPAEWTRHAAMLLVLLAFISLSSFHGKSTLGCGSNSRCRSASRCGATAHLLANGRKADVVMFGFFFALALLDILLSTARGKIPHYEPQLRSDIIAVGASIVLYLVFLFGFHPYVLNVPIV